MTLLSFGGIPAAGTAGTFGSSAPHHARVGSSPAEIALTAAHLATLEQRVERDRQRLARDAINAYVYSIPENQTATLFGGSAPKADASSEYANAAVGNISADEAALNAQLNQLNATERQWQSQERQTTAAVHHAQALRP